METLPYSKYNNKNNEEKLLYPYIYTLQAPGKSYRLKLTKALNYWLNIPEDKLTKIEEIVYMSHIAGIVIDDIQDGSTLRRGNPSAYLIYGIQSTVNAMNYVSFIALEKILDLNHPDAIKIASEQTLNLYRGQGMEIYWRDNSICPTEEEYKEMTIRKVGASFTLGVKLMQLFSENNVDLTNLTNLLGYYYQIRDDYMNLHSKDYMINKTYCEDLTEGKFSFPVIHAIRSQPLDNQVMSILRKRTADVELKKYCVSLLEKFGSFEYTRNVLKQLNTEMREEIKKIGPHPFIEELLNTFLKLE